MIHGELRSSIEGLAFPAIPSPEAALMYTVLQQLDASQWWPAARLQSWQQAQLGLLLKHALDTVPYYQQSCRQRRQCLPERPGSDYLASLPILRRVDAQAGGDDLLTRSLPKSHGQMFRGKTSGSTGTPVGFARSSLSRLMWRIFQVRSHLWEKRDFKGVSGAIRWAERGAGMYPEGIRQPGWGNGIDALFKTGPTVFLNVVSRLEDQLTWLQRERPDYLLSYPSNLAALADYCLAHGGDLPGVRELRTTGETLTTRHRQVIAQAWSLPLVDAYTCEEAGVIALQCPEQSERYHVQAENVLLEVVDADGQACQPGQTGRVLVTSLHNFASPLIRYELGDMATVGEACACGRGLPVLQRIDGRQRSRLRLPGARSVFPYLGEHGQIQSLTGLRVQQFQVVQHSLTEIEYKLVLERPFTPEEAGKVAALAQRNLGHPFDIRFSFPSDIPRQANGKFEEFVCAIPSD